MPATLENPFRGNGLTGLGPLPATDPEPVAALLALCPAHAETPLIQIPTLAQRAGAGAFWIKDERGRMGLGSFKALGAAYVIATDAATARNGGDWGTALSGQSYLTASAGNHGLSVAAGARIFGAKATIYIAETVPEAFAERLRAQGATVVRAGADYEASMAAAEAAAEAGLGTLLSDSSWPGYIDPPHRLMEGYLQMASEAVRQSETPPTHVFLQAGVGGMAGAVAAHLRAAWGDAPTIVVVEPEAAPALIESIRAGQIVETTGPVSAMGRLDCKTPSLIALAGLARDADLFVTITEEEAKAGTKALAEIGIGSTPSGSAGVAAALTGRLELPSDARILTFVTEGDEGG